MLLPSPARDLRNTPMCISGGVAGSMVLETAVFLMAGRARFECLQRMVFHWVSWTEAHCVVTKSPVYVGMCLFLISS